MQKQYIGVKLVLAQPMTRGEFHASTKNPAMLSTDQAIEDGYEVEYLDGGKPNIDGRDGYVSWCPEEQFEKANRPTDGMSFGLALEALKQGSRIARKGWVGEGVFAYYVPAATYPATSNTLGTMVGVFPEDKVPYQAYIALKTAQDTVEPWAPSQPDMFADDWVIVS